MTDLLERVRAALPGAQWLREGPGDPAPAETPAEASVRVTLGLGLDELHESSGTIVLVNDESRDADPELVGSVVRTVVSMSGRAKVLIARGSHAPLPPPAFDELSRRLLSRVDAWRREAVSVVQHDARDAASLASFEGTTLHRDVVEADVVVAVGSVEPHYFAGWAGAHKTATVGVMGLPSIQASHELALEKGARPLALEGNPVFDAIARVAQAFGPRLICVNDVRAGGRSLAWGIGGWRLALHEVVPMARDAFVRAVEAPVDLLVASVEGALGRSLYQAEKGVKNSEDAVVDGGAVVLSAPCDHGTGPARFLEVLEAARDHASALSRVKGDGYRLGDHKAVKVRALEARGVSWHLACPGLAANADAARAVRAAGLELHATLEDALSAAAKRTSARRALLVEDAARVVVEVARPQP